MKKWLLALVFLLTATCSWSQSIRRVTMKELVEYIQKAEKPLVVNFWSTYCKPCIEEIPYFQEKTMSRPQDSIELILVSLDIPAFYPAKIEKFAQDKKFTAPLFWLNETDADYYCPMIDAGWSGVIPATLFVNNKTGYRHFQEEKIKEVDFEKILKALTAK